MIETFDRNNYSHSFQIKVITLLISNESFLRDAIDLIKPKYFESKALHWLCKLFIEYYEKYNDKITLEAIKIELSKQISDKVLKTTITEAVSNAINHLNSPELEFVKDEVITFCRNQSMTSALMKSVDLLHERKFDDILSTMTNAMRVTVSNDLGHDFKEDMDKMFDESARNTMETPWPIINEITDGGLGGGELGIFIASTGAGKSWSLINLAFHAMKQGKNVIYYTMELKAAYVAQRFASILSGIAPQNIKYHRDEIKRKATALSGALKVQYYPNGTATINTLKAHAEKCRIKGFKTDMIIIDYPDLLKNSVQFKRNDLNLGNIYADARTLAGEWNIPVWGASQAQRSADESDIITGNQIAEAWSKIFVADFVVSLSRKMTDKVAGTGRWHIVKNRFGQDGLTFPSKINFSCGKIDIYDDTSVSGKEVKAQMNQGDEYMRKLYKKKYEDIRGSSLDDDSGELDINTKNETDIDDLD